MFTPPRLLLWSTMFAAATVLVVVGPSRRAWAQAANAPESKTDHAVPAASKAEGRSTTPQPQTIAQRGRNISVLPPSPAANIDPAKRKAWVMVCDGVVDPPLADWIKTQTRAAIADGATHVIYEIDTYGGLAMAALDIMDFISGEAAAKVHTVAYIPDKAISAGAMIALACRDIYVTSTAKIGASAPVLATGQEIGDVERTKTESVLRSHVRTLAQAHGWSEALCEAMITRPNEAIIRVYNRKADRFEYVPANELPTDKAVYDLDTKRRVLAAKDLLTMTGREAYDYGFAEAVVSDLDGLLADLAVTAPPVRHTAPQREDFMILQAAKALDSPIVAGAVIAAALLFLTLGLKTGEPQLLLIGIGAFVVFFTAKHTTGHAELWEIMLVVSGLGLVVLEILFMAGMGSLLIAGAGLFMVGLVLCFLPPFDLSNLTPAGSGGQASSVAELRAEMLLADLIAAVFTVTFSTMFSLLGFWLTLSYMHKIPLLRRAVLSQTQTNPVAVAAGTQKGELSPQILPLGARGLAETPLRPVGKVRFGDMLTDVVADGVYLDPGDLVEVIAVEGYRILVRKA